MKKIITGFLVVMVSFVFCYETVDYCSKMIGEKGAYSEVFPCEEGEKESEESKEKNEESKISGDLFNYSLLSFHKELSGIISRLKNNFSSSDYSQVVYSPPELL